MEYDNKVIVLLLSLVFALLSGLCFGVIVGEANMEKNRMLGGTLLTLVCMLISVVMSCLLITKGF